MSRVAGTWWRFRHEEMHRVPQVRLVTAWGSAEIPLEICRCSFVERGVMSADADLPTKAFDGVRFDDFYDRALPVAYGYLLRLCGGDREEAWDLTQDSWVALAHSRCAGKAAPLTRDFTRHGRSCSGIEWL